MKKYLFTLSFLLISSTAMLAQQRQYTMKDAVLGLSDNLAPENIKQIQWIPGTHQFTKAKDQSLVAVQVPQMKETTLFGLDEINKALSDKEPLKELPNIGWLNGTTPYFKNGNIYYTGSRLGGVWTFKKWRELPKEVAEVHIDKVGQQIGFTVGNNIFMMDHYGKTHQITHETDPWIESGKVVSRNEFGINDGMYFSPKGKYLAFYQMDETAVKDYPVIHWDDTPAKNINVKYPMAGQKSQIVTLGIYNPVTKKTVFMETGKSDHYLTNVTWDPNEKYIYIGILNRAQNHLQLNKYDVQTGKLVQTLFEEKDEKYVQPQEPLAFIPGTDNQFLWWSQRDGFMHLYRYNTDGKLLKKVTSGDWVVNEIKGWNPAKKEVIISSSALSPLDKNIYAVNWQTGRIRRMDNAAGTHSAKISEDGNYWIDQYSNYQTPNHIQVAATTGSWNKDLLNAENPLKDFAAPQIREVNLTAADGKTKLYGRLILPPNFDSTKVYPTIVYLYNGPNVQLLHNRFPESGNLWYDYMAQHGYIIFTMDGRGSSNRGLAFEQATFHHLGTVEMEDQLKGVDYLKSLSFVDQKRMGVHGWSFGGFMTISLMLRHPGVFQCAVAGGPVIDWDMYEIMYTERYMGTPQNNPEGYKEASLLDKVKNLDGDLLVIHGAMDSTVVWQHSMRFLHACIQEGVQVDYFVYPAYPHNVRGKDRVHLMQKITDYFDRHLKE